MPSPRRIWRRRPSDRADYYRWIFFTSGPVEAAFSNKAAGWEPTPERQRMFGYGNYDLAIDTLEKALDRPRVYRRRLISPPPTCSSAPTSISCSHSTCSSRGRCSSIMPARMTDRDAYRRAKEIDGKLIAEAAGAAAATAAGGLTWTEPTRQRAIDLYDRFTHDGMERRAFMTEMVRIGRQRRRGRAADRRHRRLPRRRGHRRRRTTSG